MTKYLALAIGVLLIALGAAGFLLKKSWEDNGKLQVSVDALTQANKAKSNATTSRAKADETVRSMPDAAKRSWLRGISPDPKR